MLILRSVRRAATEYAKDVGLECTGGNPRRVDARAGHFINPLFSPGSIDRRDFLSQAPLLVAAITSELKGKENSPPSNAAEQKPKAKSDGQGKAGDAPQTARLYRRSPDSSSLTSPRVFVRVFPTQGALVKTVRFYESLTRVSLDQDMDMPDSGLHVVAVGPFLILEIDPGKVSQQSHGQATNTPATVLVSHLETEVARQVANGAIVVQQRYSAPPGPGMRLRHPDGLLTEYVAHRPSQYDVGEPGPLLR